jgi:RNA polymerase sigma-70 factor (ECF subfamily)
MPPIPGRSPRGAESLQGGRRPAAPRAIASLGDRSAGGEAVRDEETTLVERLREGDERAFEETVVALFPDMFAVARGYVRAPGVAEEVVQEAWIAVFAGIDRFEGRSPLRAWVLRFVANIARDRAVREARSLPFSAVVPDDEEPVVDPSRFLGPDDPFPGGWRSFPSDWRTLPEPRLLGRETLELVARAIADLPEAQRTVITLRDVTGCDAREVSEILGISQGNQRVLLHRARVRVRAQLERHLDG